MAKVGIIGWGVVGQAVGQGFAKKHSVFWYDKYKEGPWTLGDVIEKSEFFFICVPTPMYHDFSGTDLSIIDGVVGNIASKIRNTSKIIIIKSTVMPRTTARLQEKYPNVNFAMNPEFLTEANAPWDFLHPDRTIIGTFSEAVSARLATLYRTILPMRSKIFLTDPISAELVKYASNDILAARIGKINEIANLCDVIGVNAREVLAAVNEEITATLLEKLLKAKLYRNVAELGIGTNPKAKITGEVLEDEKVMGTCHIAFGNNRHFGGNVDVPFHVDFVIRNPTIYADNILIMNNGKFSP